MTWPLPQDISDTSEFKVQLQTRLKISDLGELSWILGLKVKRNCQAPSIALSQKAYVETILEHSRLQDAKSMHIPMHSGSVLSINQSPSTSKELENMQDFPYQHAIGSLIYVATSMRPEIAFPVTALLQFMRNPGHVHWEAVKDVIRYLKGTADF